MVQLLAKDLRTAKIDGSARGYKGFFVTCKNQGPQAESESLRFDYCMIMFVSSSPSSPRTQGTHFVKATRTALRTPASWLAWKMTAIALGSRTFTHQCQLWPGSRVFLCTFCWCGSADGRWSFCALIVSMVFELLAWFVLIGFGGGVANDSYTACLRLVLSPMKGDSIF